MVRRERLGGFVSLDFHTRRQFFPLAIALRVERDARPDRDAVYSALRAGAFECRAFRRRRWFSRRATDWVRLEMCERLRKRAARQLRRVTG